jgi:DNA helicase HerA-like ATPase
MNEVLGRVLTVDGSQITASLDTDPGELSAVRVGAMVSISGPVGEVVGTVSAVRLEPASPTGRVLVVDLLGEIFRAEYGGSHFLRGVSNHPAPGTPVICASNADLETVYVPQSRSSIQVGTLYNDSSQPAFLMVNELLAKHFALLGATGAGKSCALTLILSAMLDKHPNAHVILLDPHNEYPQAFPDIAESVNSDNLQLPFWLFDFEEASRVLIRGGTQQEQESQAMILKDVITAARMEYAKGQQLPFAITVDTPIPYLTADLLNILSQRMGKLDKPDSATPYLRLKTRFESLRNDPRFKFMFTDTFDAPDRLSEVVGRLLRIPVRGKPLTIVDLSGMPGEIVDVVVSLLCRVLFDFAVWSERDRMPPVLLVCEEAHRYIPEDERVGFAATSRAITRLAKEGRKYGVSLALISQRPSELSAQALSQCGTIFAMRLGNELDQEFVAKVIPFAARGMLNALAGLPTQQAIASGEGVPLTMRLRFSDLPEDRRPRSISAEFSQAWQRDSADVEFRDEAVWRWRLQSRQAEQPR